MPRFSLLQQLTEQQQGDATWHLQACEAALPDIFTHYLEGT